MIASKASTFTVIVVPSIRLSLSHCSFVDLLSDVLYITTFDPMLQRISCGSPPLKPMLLKKFTKVVILNDPQFWLLSPFELKSDAPPLAEPPQPWPNISSLATPLFLLNTTWLPGLEPGLEAAELGAGLEFLWAQYRYTFAADFFFALSTNAAGK